MSGSSALPESDVWGLVMIGTVHILLIGAVPVLLTRPLGCFISLMLFGIILAQVGASFRYQVYELLLILRQ